MQPDAADLVADVLKALLAGQHWKSAKPNEVAIWLKAVMTTMDVLAHLLRSSWQKRRWAHSKCFCSNLVRFLIVVFETGHRWIRRFSHFRPEKHVSNSG